MSFSLWRSGRRRILLKFSHSPLPTLRGRLCEGNCKISLPVHH